MGRVVVVGSINMDVVARADRLPRPGETVFGKTVSLIPGGKGANQAVAARRIGVETTMVGALGSDGFADVLFSFLEAEGLDLSLVERVGGPTGTALISLDAAGENSIVIVPGANTLVEPTVVTKIALKGNDVVLIQNEVPEAVNAAAVDHAQRVGATTVLNLAPFRITDENLLNEIGYLIVNETEFAESIGEDPELMSSHRVTGLLAEGAGFGRNVVVTLGAEGVSARLGASVTTIRGHRVSVVDTTGAGDSFCGTLGAALARGSDPKLALAYANAAAALSVQKLGAGPSMPAGTEVDEFLRSKP
jgi:ribokinase